MAYAECTCYARFAELDKARGEDGILLRADNRVRLAKMEQLDIEMDIKALKIKLDQANRKLAKAIQEFDTWYYMSY